MLFLMATKLFIATYNLQEYNCGLSFLSELMVECGVVADQKHWLQKCELGKLMVGDKWFD